MSPERRLVLTFAIPVLMAIILMNEWIIPGFMRHFFDAQVVFFVVTYWLGLLFSNMYFYMTKDLKDGGASPKTVAIAAGVTAFVMLMAAGGPSAIWQTPWLVGIGVMPGVDIAWPVAKEWWAAKQATTTGALSVPAEASSAATPSLTLETPLEPDGEASS